MATTGILRSRRSVAQLYALARVEREIRANDPAAGRKYLRDFREAYRSYEKVLTAEQVRSAIGTASVVLIGDYHALPNSQRYVTSLLHSPELADRKLVIGIETVFARDQHILDEWLRGEIDEAELRQRIRFDFDWGYDWQPLFELLSAARDRGHEICGLDCLPREDLRKIGARDRHAADKIAEIRASHPDALILVLFGESHLAPQHLPERVRERLPGESLLTVLQNVDALFWRAAGEPCDRVEAVQVRQHVLCVFNSTPLEKYENYRLWLDRWKRDGGGAPDLGPTVYNLMDGLVRLLEINRYSPTNTTQPRFLVDLMPEVYSRSSDTLLRRLLSRKGFSTELRRSLLRRVRERGSAYLPQLNAIYVRRFDMMTASEDAARFLHHACRGLPNLVNGKLPRPLPTEDAFYVGVLENALGHFGSRILYPMRPAFRDADLYEFYELTHEDLEQETELPYRDAIEAIDFLALHREYDRTERKLRTVPDWQNRVLVFTGRKYEFVQETLGALAGNALYDAYLDGRVRPRALRKLFLTHIEEPGLARETYFHLSTQLR
jgi:hypothetical protein